MGLVQEARQRLIEYKRRIHPDNADIGRRNIVRALFAVPVLATTGELLAACSTEKSSVNLQKVRDFVQEQRTQFLAVYNDPRNVSLRGKADTQLSRSLSVTAGNVTYGFSVKDTADERVVEIKYSQTIISKNDKGQKLIQEESARLTRNENTQDWTMISTQTQQVNEEDKVDTHPQYSSSTSPKDSSQLLMTDKEFDEIVHESVEYGLEALTSRLDMLHSTPTATPT
jgi:hypothetical protein